MCSSTPALPKTTLPQTRYQGPEQWQPLFERLRAELRAIPGVADADVAVVCCSENGGSMLYAGTAVTRGRARAIVVAHRLSTVRHAHRIWVLDAGRVAEAGTHDELVARDGAYAALWRVQTGEAVA